MEISLNCTDPAVATIGDCVVEIPDERLVELAANSTVLYSPPRSNRMIIDYRGNMFEFQYRHEFTDVWEDVPKDLWDARVLSHRKRIILRSGDAKKDENNLPHEVADSGAHIGASPNQINGSAAAQTS